jgi:diguanylate cyclase (GGDEF)-like protein/PAS domain S-box-containing protein
MWAAGSFAVGWALGQLRRVSLADRVSSAIQRRATSASAGRHQPTRRSDPRESDHFTSLVGQTTDVILVIDNDDRVCFASPSARHLLGTSMLLGRDFLDFVEPAERHTARFLLSHVRDAAGGGTAHADITIRAIDGQLSRTELACRDLRTDVSVRGLALTLRDVTSQRRLEAELTRQVFWDQVTGLSSRASFHDALGRATAANTSLVGVLLLDLDRFRAINEGLGREMGDAVLTAVGGRLRKAAGEENLTARLGGDEFGVLIPHADNESQILDTATRVIASFDEPLPGRLGAIPCRSSMGVAVSTAGDDEHELLRQADVALDTAKSTARGSWRRYESAMTEAVAYRTELQAALSSAVDDGSLIMEYQPVLSLTTMRTVGFEGLVRWQHPTRGLLPPAEFIDIAEESDLIHPIGERVLTSAAAAASRWQSDSSAQPYVAVNVSVRQFRSPEFVDTVHRIVERAGIPSNHLVLEITESLLLRDDDQIWDDLRQLRNRGIRIAIDDFGTGYSALGYLRQVPLDIVKLDRVFISTMVSSSRQRALVRGIVSLASALGLETVAEGIESPQQRDICADVGCTYGQGYLFARPMPEPATTQWLAAEQARLQSRA